MVREEKAAYLSFSSSAWLGWKGSLQLHLRIGTAGLCGDVPLALPNDPRWSGADLCGLGPRLLSPPDVCSLHYWHPLLSQVSFCDVLVLPILVLAAAFTLGGLSRQHQDMGSSRSKYRWVKAPQVAWSK